MTTKAMASNATKGGKKKASSKETLLVVSKVKAALRGHDVITVRAHDFMA